MLLGKSINRFKKIDYRLPINRKKISITVRLVDRSQALKVNSTLNITIYTVPTPLYLIQLVSFRASCIKYDGGRTV